MTKPVHTLVLQNPVLKAGKNVTVRLGQKWRDLLLPGDVVQLAEIVEGVQTPLLSARITTVLDMPLDWGYLLTFLPDEHDPACRTLEGLHAELERVYDRALPKNAQVTVIEFVVLAGTTGTTS